MDTVYSATIVRHGRKWSAEYVIPWFGLPITMDAATLAEAKAFIGRETNLTQWEALGNGIYHASNI